MSDAFTTPSCLAVSARAEGRVEWLATIDDTVAMFCDAWSLTVEPPFQPGGHTAWVAPARTHDGADVVLKVAWRHPESDHEAAGLEVWAGAGAVRLVDSAELSESNVLLLERCMPGTALSEQPEPVQDEVIARLLQRLWVPPAEGEPFRPLQDMCDYWAGEFDEKRVAGHVTLDAGLADEGIALFRSLPVSADRHVLLCTDLHAGNVLAAQREPWLAIDPKPYVGDPTYDALQHMLNCPRRLTTDPLGLVARVADLLDLDRDRLRQWLFARCVQESPGWPELGPVARRLGSSAA